MTGLPNCFIFQDSPWQWHSTSCSYFLRTLSLTPQWHWHTTWHLSCPSGTFGACTRPSFPDQTTTHHTSWSSSQTLFLKPLLPSQRPTIPFSPLFFPDNLHFRGNFSLTLLRIHTLSLGFSPFWDIILVTYYTLSTIYQIQILLKCVTKQ